MVDVVSNAIVGCSVVQTAVQSSVLPVCHRVVMSVVVLDRAVLSAVVQASVIPCMMDRAVAPSKVTIGGLYRITQNS